MVSKKATEKRILSSDDYSEDPVTEGNKGNILSAPESYSDSDDEGSEAAKSIKMLKDIGDIDKLKKITSDDSDDEDDDNYDDDSE